MWWCWSLLQQKGAAELFKVQTGEAMTNKTFRLPIVLVTRLTQVANREKVSVNNLVRQCCEYALGEMGNTRAASAKS